MEKKDSYINCATNFTEDTTNPLDEWKDIIDETDTTILPPLSDLSQERVAIINNPDISMKDITETEENGSNMFESFVEKKVTPSLVKGAIKKLEKRDIAKAVEKKDSSFLLEKLVPMIKNVVSIMDKENGQEIGKIFDSEDAKGGLETIIEAVLNSQPETEPKRKRPSPPGKSTEDIERIFKKESKEIKLDKG